jgi:hypothetical protein
MEAVVMRGNWAAIVLIGLFCFGGGVAAGIGIGAMGERRAASEAISERDSAKAENVATADQLARKEKVIADLTGELRKGVDDATTSKRAGAEHERELALVRNRCQSFATSYLQSQVLICMMRDFDPIRDLIRGPSFRERYKPEWFQPDECMKLVGGKWFADDLAKYGIVVEDELKASSSRALSRRPADWRVVKSWQVKGSKTTETFYVSSSPWRVRWESRGSDYPNFYVYEPGPEEHSVASGGSEGNDSSVIYAKPGYYYLWIGASSRASIFVEEQSATP